MFAFFAVGELDNVDTSCFHPISFSFLCGIEPRDQLFQPPGKDENRAYPQEVHVRNVVVDSSSHLHMSFLKVIVKNSLPIRTGLITLLRCHLLGGR